MQENDAGKKDQDKALMVPTTGGKGPNKILKQNQILLFREVTSCVKPEVG